MVAGQIPIAATATTVTSSANLSGDVTSAAGLVTTLATVNASVGTFQGLTLNAKGLVTSAANQNYAPLAAPTFTGATVTFNLTSFAAPIVVTQLSGTAYGIVSLNNNNTNAGMTGIIGGGDPNLYLQSGSGNVQLRAAGVTGCTMSSAGDWSVFSGIVAGSPTGGLKGPGTVNAVTVYGNNVVLTSDAGLKADIEALPECLPLVAAIEPKSFRWLPLEDEKMQPPGFTTARNRGFLAQDVAQVLGGLPGGVDLGGLVAVLWQAVRELQARLEAYEAR
jgi:hypothetical protein